MGKNSKISGKNMNFLFMYKLAYILFYTEISKMPSWFLDKDNVNPLFIHKTNRGLSLFVLHHTCPSCSQSDKQIDNLSTSDTVLCITGNSEEYRAMKTVIPL
jgi:hypothetical protein